MSTAQRSDTLYLYAAEDVLDNNYQFSVKNTQAKMEFTSAVQMEFDSGGSYLYKKSDDTTFDLETRFGAAESDISTNNTAHSTSITALQSDLAAEANSRAAADTTNSNATSAEVAARVVNCDTNEAKTDQEVLDRASADTAISTALTTEVSDRTTAVAAEAAIARAAETALSNQISSILSNSDPAAIDSLSEVVAAYTSGDTTLATQASDMLTRLQVIENILAEAFDLTF